MYERQQAKANLDAMIAHLDAGIAMIQAKQVELSAAKHLLFEQREQYAEMARTLAGQPPPDATPEETSRFADAQAFFAGLANRARTI
ncbi:hypothetical protein SEA_GUYFAGIERI_3 [Rhodococcus phage GuyFagieri]|nr:hypothetical protein SEA_GUYFAGIERI_3 [Rhodococcus phage GuyFagieri]